MGEKDFTTYKTVLQGLASICDIDFAHTKGVQGVFMSTLAVPAKRKVVKKSSTTGRPLKYGEPMVVRQFRLPESLNERMTNFAGEVGEDVSVLVRRAVENEMNGQSESESKTKEAVKSALLELIPGLRTAGSMVEEWDAARERAQATDVPVWAALQINSNLALAEAREGFIEKPTFLRPVVGESNLRPVKILAEPPCGPWKEALEHADEHMMDAGVLRMMGFKEGDFFVRCDGESMVDAGIPDGALVLMRPLDGDIPKNGTITLVCAELDGGDWFGTVKRFFKTPEGKVDLRDGKGMPIYTPREAIEIKPVAFKVGLIAGSEE